MENPKSLYMIALIDLTYFARLFKGTACKAQVQTLLRMTTTPGTEYCFYLFKTIMRHFSCLSLQKLH